MTMTQSQTNLIAVARDMIEQEYVTNGSECDAMDLAFDYILAMVCNTKITMTILWHACEQLGMNLV